MNPKVTGINLITAKIILKRWKWAAIVMWMRAYFAFAVAICRCRRSRRRRHRHRYRHHVYILTHRRPFQAHSAARTSAIRCHSIWNCRSQIIKHWHLLKVSLCVKCKINFPWVCFLIPIIIFALSLSHSSTNKDARIYTHIDIHIVNLQWALYLMPLHISSVCTQ